MKKTNNIFIDSLPMLDLHGLDRMYAGALVVDFIKENLLLKNEKIVIIHGIGEGIIKKHIHNILKNNRDVKEYKTDYYNEGITLVYLIVDKKQQM